MQIQKQLQSEHRDVASSATRTTVETFARRYPGTGARHHARAPRRSKPRAGSRSIWWKRCRSIGIFRLFVPRSHGGLELDLPTALEIIAALGRIDGSVGWTAMIGCGSGIFAPLLPRETYEQSTRTARM